jgi:hypothetical protein
MDGIANVVRIGRMLCILHNGSRSETMSMEAQRFGKETIIRILLISTKVSVFFLTLGGSFVTIFSPC